DGPVQGFPDRDASPAGQLVQPRQGRFRDGKCRVSHVTLHRSPLEYTGRARRTTGQPGGCRRGQRSSTRCGKGATGLAGGLSCRPPAGAVRWSLAPFPASGGRTMSRYWAVALLFLLPAAAGAGQAAGGKKEKDFRAEGKLTPDDPRDTKRNTP